MLNIYFLLAAKITSLFRFESRALKIFEDNEKESSRLSLDFEPFG
ncbi:MAG: hypothetical protein R3E32_00950 [Chitinophagales bacterium]